MSRSSYSEDFGDEFPGQIDLFRANVRRSFRSKIGQQRLRELHAALLALPKKELYPNIFVEAHEDGPHVCALGAWMLAKCDGDVTRASSVISKRWEIDDEEILQALQTFANWPKLVVYDTVWENDEGSAYWIKESPAARYERIVKWVEAQIR